MIFGNACSRRCAGGCKPRSPSRIRPFWDTSTQSPCGMEPPTNSTPLPYAYDVPAQACTLLNGRPTTISTPVHLPPLPQSPVATQEPASALDWSASSPRPDRASSQRGLGRFPSAGNPLPEVRRITLAVDRAEKGTCRWNPSTASIREVSARAEYANGHAWRSGTLFALLLLVHCPLFFRGIVEERPIVDTQIPTIAPWHIWEQRPKPPEGQYQRHARNWTLPGLTTGRMATMSARSAHYRWTGKEVASETMLTHDLAGMLIHRMPQPRTHGALCVIQLRGTV